MSQNRFFIVEFTPSDPLHTVCWPVSVAVCPGACLLPFLPALLLVACLLPPCCLPAVCCLCRSVQQYTVNGVLLAFYREEHERRGQAGSNTRFVHCTLPLINVSLFVLVFLFRVTMLICSFLFRAVALDSSLC